MRKHIFYNTVNFQPVTFRILFFRGIQTLEMRLSRKACFWWTQLLRPFCRAADEFMAEARCGLSSKFTTQISQDWNSANDCETFPSIFCMEGKETFCYIRHGSDISYGGIYGTCYHRSAWLFIAKLSSIEIATSMVVTAARGNNHDDLSLSRVWIHYVPATYHARH